MYMQSISCMLNLLSPCLPPFRVFVLTERRNKQSMRLILGQWKKITLQSYRILVGVQCMSTCTCTFEPLKHRTQNHPCVEVLVYIHVHVHVSSFQIDFSGIHVCCVGGEMLLFLRILHVHSFMILIPCPCIPYMYMCTYFTGVHVHACMEMVSCRGHKQQEADDRV